MSVGVDQVKDAPFLTVELDQWLDVSNGLATRYEFPPAGVDPRTNSENLSDEYLQLTGDSMILVAKLQKALPTAPTNLDEVESFLVVKGFQEVLGSTYLRLLGQLAAIETAWHTVMTGNEMQELYGHEVGHKAVRLRAQREATALLVASSLLIRAESFDEQSIWHRAKVVHDNNPRLRAPVEINEQQFIILGALQTKATAADNAGQPLPIKLSRSKKVNARQVNQYMRQIEEELYPDNTVELNLETAESIIDNLYAPVVPDLSNEEISHAVRLTRSMKRYIDSAARVDRSVAADPRARYLSFLCTRLTSYNIKDYRVAFARDVNKFANKLRGELPNDRLDESQE